MCTTCSCRGRCRRWRRCGDVSVRAMIASVEEQSCSFFVEQAIWGMSVLARYVPTHYSQVNQYLTGVFYVGSQIARRVALVHPRRQARADSRGLSSRQL